MKFDAGIAEISTTEPTGSASRDSSFAHPRVIQRAAEIREAVLAARRGERTIGLVPTMGALHEGHLSLLDRARAECDLTVATIFVNPLQFGPNEDFQRYPRNLGADVALLADRGCELVFAPSVEEIFPPGHTTTVDVGPLGQTLEGEFRPTHFRGVATVVLKLFQLIPAHRAYFGRKDYQQTLVIQRMVDDLNVPIDVRICPTVREPDGLAMSSRNAYLTPDERARARSLSQSLRLAEELVASGERDVAAIRKQMQQLIERAGGVGVQYITFLADGTLNPVQNIDGPTTVAIAAHVGRTRLIDNTTVG